METLPVDVYTCTAPRLGGARLKQGGSEKFGMESGGKNDWTTGGRDLGYKPSGQG